MYRYGYGGEGHLVTVTYPDATPADDSDNPVRAYGYDDPDFPHALTGIIDANGERFATWVYDGEGRAVLSEHAGGADRVVLEYDPDGTTTITNALGQSQTIAFTSLHGLTRPTTVTGGPCDICGGLVAQSSYTGEGFLGSKTDFNGNTTAYAHNGRGLEIHRTEALGTPQERIITTEWHPEFRLPTLVTGQGRDTTYAYDDAGRLLVRTETGTAGDASRTTTYTYTPDGQLAAVDGPRTDIADLTAYTYDGQGHRTATTNALGQVAQITAHDAHGHPLTLEDPNGRVTLLDYDPRGRLLSKDVGGSVTTFTYDPAGNLTRLTLPDGSYLEYTYDPAHRLIGMMDNLGNRIHYTLDALGNRILEQVFDPGESLSRTRQRIYNQLNRLIQDIGGEGQVRDYTYDLQGNRVSITDPLGHTATNTFDALNRLTAATDPLGGHTGYGYDAGDKLVGVTDPNGNTTSYGYDGLGNRIQQTSPDTGATTYSYDDAGNLTSKTDAGGVTVSYVYDALNRPIAIQYPDEDQDVYLYYDEGENGIGRLTHMTDPAGETDYAYDARGNVIGETRTRDSVTYVTEYAYDTAGRLVQITYPGGRSVDYTRNATGRIIEITTTDPEGVTQTLATAIAYLPFGPLAGLTLGNGIQLSRSYDLDYRLSGQSAGTILDLAYTRDGNGNLTAIDNNLDPGRHQQFGYDPLDRLESAQGIYGQRDYGHDPVGNRTDITRDAQSDTYTLAPDSNRLLEVAGTTTESYAYDAGGSMTAKGDYSFTYNQHNRLNEAAVSGVPAASYAYNGKGQRVEKEAGGETTVFHYDRDGRLIAESDAAGQMQREYIYLEGRPLALVDYPDTTLNNRPRDLNGDGVIDIDDVLLVIDARNTPLDGPADPRDLDGDGIITVLDARKLVLLCDYRGCVPGEPPQGAGGASGPQLYYVHASHLGTPLAITGEDQAIVWQADYTPFGTAMVTTAILDNRLRFPGQYFDAETGLHYNYYRDYDPSTGRYIESDPIGLDGGINTYSYVSNNPMVHVDPFGLLVFSFGAGGWRHVDT